MTAGVAVARPGRVLAIESTKLVAFVGLAFAVKYSEIALPSTNDGSIARFGWAGVMTAGSVLLYKFWARTLRVYGATTWKGRGTTFLAAAVASYLFYLLCVRVPTGSLALGALVTGARPLAVILAVMLLRFFEARIATGRKSLLHVPPGTRVRGLLSFLYGRKTMHNVFEPLLADIQAEWLEANQADQRARAAWICLRGYVNIIQHVGAQGLVSSVRLLFNLWKASH